MDFTEAAARYAFELKYFYNTSAKKIALEKINKIDGFLNAKVEIEEIHEGYCETCYFQTTRLVAKIPMHDGILKKSGKDKIYIFNCEVDVLGIPFGDIVKRIVEISEGK